MAYYGKSKRTTTRGKKVVKKTTTTTTTTAPSATETTTAETPSATSTTGTSTKPQTVQDYLQNAQANAEASKKEYEEAKGALKTSLDEYKKNVVDAQPVFDMPDKVEKPDESTYDWNRKFAEQYAIKPLSEEERKKRIRGAYNAAGIANLGNAISAFSNLAFTGRGAPSQTLPDAMNPHEEVKEFNDEQEAKGQKFMETMMNARGLDSSEYAKAYDRYMAGVNARNAILQNQYANKADAHKTTLDIGTKLTQLGQGDYQFGVTSAEDIRHNIKVEDQADRQLAEDVRKNKAAEKLEARKLSLEEARLEWEKAKSKADREQKAKEFRLTLEAQGKAANRSYSLELAKWNYEKEKGTIPLVGHPNGIKTTLNVDPTKITPYNIKQIVDTFPESYKKEYTDLEKARNRILEEYNARLNQIEEAIKNGDADVVKALTPKSDYLKSLLDANSERTYELIGSALSDSTSYETSNFLVKTGIARVGAPYTIPKASYKK